MITIKLFFRLTLIVLLTSLSGCAALNNSISVRSDDSSADLFLISVDAQRAYRESRWIDAVRLYQTLVEKVPNDASAWFHLANTYAHQGVFQSAIHAYEQSLQHDNAQPKAWFNLSSVYLLNAQSAMRYSSALMESSDPSRGMIAKRLSVLDNLLHGRIASHDSLELNSPSKGSYSYRQRSPK